MPADTTVKNFHSAMPGAPVLSGTAGSLIAVLDACLVNGFGVSSVASLVVAGGIATATVSGGHSAEVGSVVVVSGATPGGLNGEKKVLTVGGGNTTLTYDATGISDQTATGAISLKIAGAGWSKAYSGTNLAAYKSGNVAATGCYLRVDDSGTTDARVTGYESMTGISAGTGAFQSVAGGGYWPKASAAGATARNWVVVADDKTAWLWVNSSTTATFENGLTLGFGDFVSYKSGDAWSCALHAPAASIAASTSSSTSAIGYAIASAGAAAGSYAARSFTSLGGGIPIGRYPELFSVGAFYSGNTSHVGAYPNGPNNGLLLSRALLAETDIPALRGVMRGVHYVMQAIGASTFPGRSKIAGQGPLVGRNLLALKGAAPAGTADSNITIFVDITGPWE
jgi:hypothetical protein